MSGVGLYASDSVHGVRADAFAGGVQCVETIFCVSTNILLRDLCTHDLIHGQK